MFNAHVVFIIVKSRYLIERTTRQRKLSIYQKTRGQKERKKKLIKMSWILYDLKKPFFLRKFPVRIVKMWSRLRKRLIKLFKFFFLRKIRRIFTTINLISLKKKNKKKSDELNEINNEAVSEIKFMILKLCVIDAH